MARRGFQVLLIVIGSVAVVAGSATVLFGVYSVLDHGPVISSVDNEMRFYAAWYVIAGLLLLSAAGKPEDSGMTIRAIALGFFIAGCGRLISWIAIGTPHAAQLVLMVIELVLPLVLVPWHASLARRSDADV